MERFLLRLTIYLHHVQYMVQEATYFFFGALPYRLNVLATNSHIACYRLKQKVVTFLLGADPKLWPRSPRFFPALRNDWYRRELMQLLNDTSLFDARPERAQRLSDDAFATAATALEAVALTQPTPLDWQPCGAVQWPMEANPDLPAAANHRPIAFPGGPPPSLVASFAALSASQPSGASSLPSVSAEAASSSPFFLLLGLLLHLFFWFSVFFLLPARRVGRSRSSAQPTVRCIAITFSTLSRALATAAPSALIASWTALVIAGYQFFASLISLLLKPRLLLLFLLWIFLLIYVSKPKSMLFNIYDTLT
ncbi:hypothetical protein INT43_003057 [Umbelopsis isabellina]|uniref:Uncharacterized protein n=1 Tax=Mortierella isabellina TaxID=91625 RepID=A0A8H7PQ87_MORIS|nr:hypothetical protein INT43_003057 [Umbelopsis isabellina]